MLTPVFVVLSLAALGQSDPAGLPDVSSTVTGLKVTILNLANLQCVTASLPISSASSTTDLVNSLLSVAQITGVVTNTVPQVGTLLNQALALAAPSSAATDCPSVVNLVKSLAPTQLVDTSSVTSAIGQNLGAINIPGLLLNPTQYTTGLPAPVASALANAGSLLVVANSVPGVNSILG